MVSFLGRFALGEQRTTRTARDAARKRICGLRFQWLGPHGLGSSGQHGLRVGCLFRALYSWDACVSSSFVRIY
jgi:hypothetical protein